MALSDNSGQILQQAAEAMGAELGTKVTLKFDEQMGVYAATAYGEKGGAEATGNGISYEVALRNLKRAWKTAHPARPQGYDTPSQTQDYESAS